MLEYKSDERMGTEGMFDIFRTTETARIPLHTHDFIEIVYVLGGSAEETVNGASFPTARGDLIFMDCACTHAFTPRSPYTYIHIGFRPEVLARTLSAPGATSAYAPLLAFDDLRLTQGVGVMHFSLPERDAVENLLLSMLEEDKKRDKMYATALQGYLYVLLCHLVRRAGGEGEETIPEPMARVAAYIDAHLSEDLTLAQLSALCYYRPSYFSRVFHNTYKMTLSEYLSRRRIRLAVRLLPDTSLSVARIGEMCGYPSRSAFYRAFAQRTGISPGEYRKRETSGTKK